MDEIEKLLSDLSKVPGTEKLVGDLRGKVKDLTTELDTARGEAGAAKKESAGFKKSSDAFKKDLDAGSGAKDVELGKAQKERDEWKTKAEQAEAKSYAARRRTAVADALGIVDPTRRKMAVDALMSELPDDVTLDDNGNLSGATKHVDAFKKRAGFFWVELDADEGGDTGAVDKKGTDKGNGGPRPGADKAPIKAGGPGGKTEPTRTEKTKSWGASLYPEDAAAAKAATK